MFHFIDDLVSILEPIYIGSFGNKDFYRRKRLLHSGYQILTKEWDRTEFKFVYVLYVNIDKKEDFIL